jgi:hypothetical protein
MIETVQHHSPESLPCGSIIYWLAPGSCDPGTCPDVIHLRHSSYPKELQCSPAHGDTFNLTHNIEHIVDGDVEHIVRLDITIAVTRHQPEQETP